MVEYRTQSRDHPILPAVPDTEYLKCFILQIALDRSKTNFSFFVESEDICIFKLLIVKVIGAS